MSRSSKARRDRRKQRSQQRQYHPRRDRPHRRRPYTLVDWLTSTAMLALGCLLATPTVVKFAAAQAGAHVPIPLRPMALATIALAGGFTMLGIGIVRHLGRSDA